MKFKNIVFVLIFLLQSCVNTEKVEGTFHITNNVKDWRDEIIYQLIVDRFADGDINNNFNVNKNSLTSWNGGDYQGIIDKIPYLKKLGITAVWISPVVKNVDSDAGIAGYHGYWTQDFLSVNPHFGDLAKLREMVDELHKNNIKVILDIVANHIGQLFYYDINKNNQPDEMIMGSDEDCSTYCSHIMNLTDKSAGKEICSQEYSANFEVGGCFYDDSCPNKKCFDNCISRCQNGYPEKIGIKRYSEWDPDFDPRGIRSFSEAGESGIAPIRWIYMPEINRVPPLPKEFQNPDWYNRKGRIVTWQSDYQVVKGDFPGGLKDLNTTRSDVQNALIKVYEYWISAADFDGFRVDTIKHVEHQFWQKFTPAIHNYARQIGKKNFFVFGESFDGDDAFNAKFTKNGEMDSVFYFSQKFQVFDAIFKHNGPTKNFEKLFNLRMNKHADGTALSKEEEKRYGTKSAIYDEEGKMISPQQLMVNFTENHDLPRFLYEKPDKKALQNALGLLLTMDGIPCIYYGTEQNFNGGNDPANRENLATSDYDTTNSTFKFISKMTAIRKKYAPLRRGTMKIDWSTNNTGNESDAGILAFERTYKNQTVLVVLNTNSKHESSTQFEDKTMKTSFKEGTVLKDVVENKKTITVGKNGEIKISIPKQTTMVFIEK